MTYFDSLCIIKCGKTVTKKEKKKRVNYKNTNTYFLLSLFNFLIVPLLHHETKTIIYVSYFILYKIKGNISVKSNFLAFIEMNKI